MALVALEVALDMVREVAVVLPRIAAQDPDLADQVKRAASSVALNLAEGKERRGRDRVRFLRHASGSCSEARAGLALAVAWGYVTEESLAAAEPRLDRLAGLLYGLTRTSGLRRAG